MRGYQPIIIIGAPRSGTNVLRDSLCLLPEVGTWPCDEINYIWRHGNIGYATDEFTIDMATSRVTNYIRQEFDQIARRNQINFLVEKTCANSLRVPFVDKVIPEAKYIFIVRDGVDSLGSAVIRWKADLDFIYSLKKLRYIPILDIPYYIFNYAINRLYRIFSSEKRLSFWGPKFKNMGQYLQDYSLEEVCAMQWKRCVDLSDAALQNIPEDRVVRVKYENLVLNPVAELSRITSELNIPCSCDDIQRISKPINSGSIGKGRASIGMAKIKSVCSLIKGILKKFDYDC